MPQAIVIVMSGIMLGLVLSPVMMINVYFAFRPLVHPFALDQLKLLSLPINWPFTVVILFGVLVNLLMRKGFRLFPYNLMPLYLLTFLSFISMAFSINLVSSVSQSIKLVSAVAIVLLVANVANSKEKVIRIYKGISLSSVIPMLYGYYQFVTGTGHVVLGEHTRRIVSFFGYANLYGIFLALVLFTTAILYFNESSKKWKRLYLVIIVSVVISSILALNRGSWIAISIGLFSAYPFYKKHLNIKYFIYAFVVIGVAAAGIVIRRFLELEEQRIGADTFSERMYTSAAILRTIFDIPLTGYGAGTAQEILMRKYGIYIVPHNDYLRLLLEMGFMAPILYIVLLVRELKFNLKTRKNVDWYVGYFMLAMMIYWMTISITQNIIHDVVVFPMFFVCCVLARQYMKYA